MGGPVVARCDQQFSYLLQKQQAADDNLHEDL